jgi:adenosylmethionine---8-amino-7-oxononanoate aminotransferase
MRMEAADYSHGEALVNAALTAPQLSVRTIAGERTRSGGGRGRLLPCERPMTSDYPNEPVLTVTKARGSVITLEDGRTLIDGATKNAILGLSPTLIQLGIEAQAARLPHSFDDVLIAAPAAKLQGRMNALLPNKRASLAPSGRFAFETALAIARKAHPGEIAGFAGGAFAGDGAPLPLPHDENSATDLTALLQARAARLAAVVIEPLVQPVAGMPFHSEETLGRVREITFKAGVPLIVDERFSGFGRLGVMYAHQAAAINADIVVLGEMLTGGTLPLGAALFSSAFAPDSSWGPVETLTASAANAFLDLFARENRLLAANEIGKKLATELGKCLKLATVKDVRVRGALGVIELATAPDAAALKRQLRMEGALVSVHGNALVVTPALTMVTKELHTLAGAIFKVLKTLGS